VNDIKGFDKLTCEQRALGELRNWIKGCEAEDGGG